MTARLTVICQGATAANRASAFPDNEPLEERTDLAFPEGQIIAGRYDEALVSPMLAARQTAEALSLRCEEDPDLQDVDYGDWAGRTIAEIAHEHADLLGQWMADPAFDGHGGESLEKLFERIGRWMANHAAGRITIVTHAAVIRAMVIATLNAPAEAFWKIDIAPLTVAKLRHDGRRWALRSCGLALAGGFRL